MTTYELIYSRKKISTTETYPLTSPEQVVEYAIKNFLPENEQWREKAYAIYLDKNQYPISFLMLSVGGTTSTVIDNRLVVKGALDTQATSVVLVHNHPSGNPFPSRMDVAETRKCRSALVCFDLKLTDHIIIGENAFFSFAQESKFSIKNR